MDKTVMILIGAGVGCMVLGLVLFFILMSASKKAKKNAAVPESPLADDYMENFQTCFNNTGSIEDTLEQLEDIYSGDKAMLGLLSSAIDYIQNGYGDYETALDKINVEGDEEIADMHSRAIQAVLGSDDDDEGEIPKKTSRRSKKESSRKSSRKTSSKQESSAQETSRHEAPVEEYEEEDDEEYIEDDFEEDEEEERPSKKSSKQEDPKKSRRSRKEEEEEEEPPVSRKRSSRGSDDKGSSKSFKI